MTGGQLRLPIGGLRRPSGVPREAALMLVATPVGAGLGVAAALHPEWWRALLAAALIVNVIVVGMKWPRAAAVATLLWLPFLGLVRRLLIAEGGWVQNDPLLLVGPVAALFLCYRIFVVERRQLAPDRLSKLVLLLLVIAFLGAINPFGVGGLFGGLAGLIYLGVPLLWFLIGRELGDRRLVLGLIYAVVVIGLVAGAYGLYQTKFGSLPQWDVDWFQITGFSGVTLGRSAAGDLLYRPWSTFASTSEYSAYLGMALMLAVAMVYHRRPAFVIAIPGLALALFLAGGRSVMALAMLSGVVLTALRTRNRVLALIVVVAGIAATYGAALTIGPRIDRATGVSGDLAAQRQVGGLLKPLDPNESTFLTHWDSLLGAVETGVRNPVGRGTGATNLGAEVGGAGGLETDIDIGDAFVSFGFVGGLVFVAIVVISLHAVFSRYLRRPRPDPLIFAVAGVLVVNLGQWLQGGHYAASALMWFLLGWAARPTPQTLEREERARQVPLQARLRGLAPWRREGYAVAESPTGGHSSRSRSR